MVCAELARDRYLSVVLYIDYEVELIIPFRPSEIVGRVLSRVGPGRPRWQKFRLRSLLPTPRRGTYQRSDIWRERGPNKA